MMIRILSALLAVLLLALPVQAETTLPAGVLTLCEDAYPAYIIAEADGWGDDARGQYALVLTDGEDNILCIAEKGEDDNAYAFTVENTNAVREGAQIPSLLIDTGGDSLYYSYTDGSTKTSYASFKNGGEWQSVSIVHQDFSHPDYDVDTLVWVNNRRLIYDKSMFDKQENPSDDSGLDQIAPIPVSAEFAAGMRLSAFDIDAISPTGMMIPAVPGLCHGLLEEGDTLLELNAQEDTLIMLVTKADGSRHIRIASGGSEYTTFSSVIETGPLPGDAAMDTWHGSSAHTLHLIINGGDIYNFVRRDGENWTLGSVQGEDGFGVHYNGVSDWNNSIYSRNDGVIYGISPWNADITELDLCALPTTFAEAVSQLDSSPYMFVNNPNPEDRLHLRVKPQKGAASLGKFYNRTPVYVIEESGDWAHVRIGSEESGLEGYMMTKFLTRDSVACAFPQMQYSESAQGVYLLDAPTAGAATRRHMDEWPGAYLIGVVGDEWYVVMTEDGCVGYIRQSLFWAGNG